MPTTSNKNLHPSHPSQTFIPISAMYRVSHCIALRFMQRCTAFRTSSTALCLSFPLSFLHSFNSSLPILLQQITTNVRPCLCLCFCVAIAPASAKAQFQRIFPELSPQSSFASLPFADASLTFCILICGVWKIICSFGMDEGV